MIHGKIMETRKITTHKLVQDFAHQRYHESAIEALLQLNALCICKTVEQVRERKQYQLENAYMRLTQTTAFLKTYCTVPPPC